MKFDIVSLFPEYFEGPLNFGIIKRAVREGLIEFNFVDLKKFGSGKWSKVDDAPFGGGPGMVISAEPIVSAVRSLERKDSRRVVYLSPQGRILNAAKSRELAGYDQLVLICGQYEGVDQRAIDLEVDEEVSIGDYVLMSGNVPALVLIDAVVRFLPGVLGNQEGPLFESFENGLLEYPQYTRPDCFEGLAVPDVLLKGNHRDINFWRLNAGIEKTRKNRPDLYWKYLSNTESLIEPETDLDGNKTVSCSVETVLYVKNVFESLYFYSRAFGLKIPSIKEKESGTEKEAVLNLSGKERLWLKLTDDTASSSVIVIAFQDETVYKKVVNKWKKLAKPVDFDGVEDSIHCVCFEDINGHRWILRLK